MRAYLITTAALFALLTAVHVWRFIEEGSRLATDPWFIGITVLAVLLCGWALRLLQVSSRE